MSKRKETALLKAIFKACIASQGSGQFTVWRHTSSMQFSAHPTKDKAFAIAREFCGYGHENRCDVRDTKTGETWNFPMEVTV
jgi:hypothetical protein